MKSIRHNSVEMDIIPDNIVGPAVDDAPEPMDVASQRIGFPKATRNRLRFEGFDAFSEVKSMKAKENIHDLVDSLGHPSLDSVVPIM